MARSNKTGSDILNAKLVREVKNNYLARVEQLLEKGADPNVCNEDGTPLVIAAIRDNYSYEIMDALLSHGADPNAEDAQNRTVLMHACIKGDGEKVRCAVAHKADPNRQDRLGNTALLYAVKKRIHSYQEECDVDDFKLMMRALFAHGADRELRNKKNQSALDVINGRKDQRLKNIYLDPMKKERLPQCSITFSEKELAGKKINRLAEIGAANYPCTRNLLHFWREADEAGTIILAIENSTHPITIRWVEYRHDGAYAKKDSRACRGVFSRKGKQITVKETYSDTRTTNAGTTRFAAEYISADGVCCTEIVDAYLSGQDLTLKKVTGREYHGLWRLEVGAGGMCSGFHEYVVDADSCIFYYDPASNNGLLLRIKKFDNSQ